MLAVSIDPILSHPWLLTFYFHVMNQSCDQCEVWFFELHTDPMSHSLSSAVVSTSSTSIIKLLIFLSNRLLFISYSSLILLSTIGLVHYHLLWIYKGQSTVGEGDICRIKEIQFGRNNYIKNESWILKEGVTQCSRENDTGTGIRFTMEATPCYWALETGKELVAL